MAFFIIMYVISQISKIREISVLVNYCECNDENQAYSKAILSFTQKAIYCLYEDR